MELLFKENTYKGKIPISNSQWNMETKENSPTWNKVFFTDSFIIACQPTPHPHQGKGKINIIFAFF